MYNFQNRNVEEGCLTFLTKLRKYIMLFHVKTLYIIYKNVHWQ